MFESSRFLAAAVLLSLTLNSVTFGQSSSPCTCDTENFISDLRTAHCWSQTGPSCVTAVRITQLSKTKTGDSEIISETVWDNCDSSTATSFSAGLSTQQRHQVCLTVGVSTAAALTLGGGGWTVSGSGESSQTRQVCRSTTVTSTGDVTQSVPAGAKRIARLMLVKYKLRFRVTTSVGWYYSWTYIGGPDCPEVAPEHIDEHFTQCYRASSEQTRTTEELELHVTDSPCN